MAVESGRARLVAPATPGRPYGEPGVAITIGVLTYRRPDAVLRCLGGILVEVDRVSRTGSDDSFQVVVVDNDPDGSAAGAVGGLDSLLIKYVLEAAPGISAARNRVIDESSGADLLLFIDDDEEPRPGWLAEHLRTWRATGAAAVAGLVVSEFDGAVDPWVAAGRFFERPSLPTGSRIAVAATNNLLLDLRVVRSLGLRFDDRFGLTGGGDTHLTRSLTSSGALMVWCDEAVVTDHVPADRARKSWVLRRARRMANTEVIVSIDLAPSPSAKLGQRLLAAGRGAARVLGGGGRYAVGRAGGSLEREAKATVTIWRGYGMLTASIGSSVAEYLRPDDNQPEADRRARTEKGAAFPRRLRRPGLTVLESFPMPRPTTNPYIVLLARSISAEPLVTLRYFSWFFALTGRYDVLHVHWPEIFVGGRRGVKKAGRQVLFALLMLRLLLTRTAIVRTLHNLQPHERTTRIERVLLSIVDRRTAVWIRLNPLTPVPTAQPVVTILHGHYIDWFAPEAVQAARGSVLFAGLVREYKNVPALIAAFREIEDDDEQHTLRIVGIPTPPELSRSLPSLAAGDPRISFALRFLADDEFAREVRGSELVVLPYAEMHNSGSALMALSLGRPILLPGNEVNATLAAEVGPGWVFRYTGTLAGRDITRALAACRTRGPADRPDLSARDWAAAGAAHVAAFRLAVQRRRHDDPLPSGEPLNAALPGDAPLKGALPDGPAAAGGAPDGLR